MRESGTIANDTESIAADTNSSTDRLFPLPFTPFEFYYLLEDRPEYASSFPITLECRGPLDREAFARAFQLTHERHPFLAARIEYDERGWPQWAAGSPPPITWGPATILHNDELSSSDAKSAGLQMTVRQRGDRTAWEFVFHHVAVDGLGAFQFIMDLFLAYAHLSQAQQGPLPWRRIDRERLRDRDGHRLFKDHIHLRDLARLIKVTLPINLRRAAVVSNHGQAPEVIPAGGNQPDDLVHHLTAEETAELSRIAGLHSVMLNDLLMRDYFLTLAAWNAGTREARRPIRILVPTNLRRREDYRMPAANVFSFTFVARAARDCRDRQLLLRSIHEEMSVIKRHKRGLYFEAGLRIFCIWPGLLRWSLSRPWPFATAIFSNLGTGLDNVPLPERDGRKVCGELVFEGGSGAAPIRPDTRVSFAIHTYAGRLAVCVRCDPRAFTVAQRQAMLAQYVEQLRETIATQT